MISHHLQDKAYIPNMVQKASYLHLPPSTSFATRPGTGHGTCSSTTGLGIFMLQGLQTFGSTFPTSLLLTPVSSCSSFKTSPKHLLYTLPGHKYFLFCLLPVHRTKIKLNSYHVLRTVLSILPVWWAQILSHKHNYERNVTVSI